MERAKAPVELRSHQYPADVCQDSGCAQDAHERRQQLRPPARRKHAEQRAVRWQERLCQAMHTVCMRREKQATLLSEQDTRTEQRILSHKLKNCPPVLANSFAAPTSYLRCFVAPKQQQTLTRRQTDRKAGQQATAPLVGSTQSSRGRLLSHRAELFCQASGLQPSPSRACICERQRLQLPPVGATYTARATEFAVWLRGWTSRVEPGSRPGCHLGACTFGMPYM